MLACGTRKYRASADGAGAIKFRIYTIFAALLSSWRCERAVGGGVSVWRGRREGWGVAGMQARNAAIALASLQVAGAFSCPTVADLDKPAPEPCTYSLAPASTAGSCPCP